MFLTNGAYAVFLASHILHTLLTYPYGYKLTNPRFLTNTTTPPQAVWAYSSGCSPKGDHSVRYEHPPIASLLIGAAQEADLVSPGFEQSRAISNRLTLDYTMHCIEQRIVLPGDASWKQLCSSTVPPDDDDETRSL